MPRKKIKIPFPAIDGKPELGKTYFTKASRTNDKDSTKNEMLKEFKDRFGYEPEVIFFGKPNGTLLYAGPLTRKPDPIQEVTTEDTGELQPELF